MSIAHRPRAIIDGIRRTRTYRFFWCRHCDRTVRITSSAHTYIFTCPLCYNHLCHELHVSRPNFAVQDNEPSSSSAAQMTTPTTGPPKTAAFEKYMPVIRVTNDMLDSNPSCAICKEDFLIDEQITKMPCCHLYHSGCILPWIRVHDTCPVCRFRVPVPSSSDNDSNIGNFHGVSHQEDIDDFRFDEAMNLTWPSWAELLSLWPFGFGSFFNWSSQDHADSLMDTASSTTEHSWWRYLWIL
ncbi:hypothetical protein RND81_14G182700 [Saponaria officinalis]|uniref:RING-type E3 ubiquitin transferase n=1 Tax=Saponaria officinalis TaxID=3572 RepID=A0AAW1GR46_SAPOF